MKTLRLIGMALMAVLICVNFVSCSNEELTPDDPNQEKYITVGLACVGEYLDIKDSPLSRAAGDDTYSIQVYSDETPYAHGIFYKSLDGVTIKLMQGAKYTFKVTIVIDKKDGSDTEFTYSSTTTLPGVITSPVIAYERFYGELDDFTPIEGKNVEISTKRVSYAAKFIAEDLKEGTLDVEVSNMNVSNPVNYTVSLTPDYPISDKIYSFNYLRSAWEGIYTQIGTDPETGEPTYGYADYTQEYSLNVKWNKSEDEIIPLGNYKVTFKRNVRTTIRIKVENPTYNNGIAITREDTAISDNENEYNIEGGEITEIPVNSES